MKLILQKKNSIYLNPNGIFPWPLIIRKCVCATWNVNISYLHKKHERNFNLKPISIINYVKYDIRQRLFSLVTYHVYHRLEDQCSSTVDSRRRNRRDRPKKTQQETTTNYGCQSGCKICCWWSQTVKIPRRQCSIKNRRTYKSMSLSKRDFSSYQHLRRWKPVRPRSSPALVPLDIAVNVMPPAEEGWADWVVVMMTTTTSADWLTTQRALTSLWRQLMM